MGKKAKVWTYFTAVVAKGRGGEELKAAQCTLCKATVLTKDYTTGPMIGHLEAHHMDEFHVVRADIDAKKAAKTARDKARDVANAKAGVHAPIPTDPTPSTSRGTASAAAASGRSVAKFPHNSAEQQRLDLEIAIFLATSNNSFAMVDSEPWKRLMSYLCPRMHIRHRTTYGGPKLDLVYEQLLSERDDLLLSELPDVSCVAITFDHWSSRNNDPFIVVTAHYINKDFDLRKMTLGLMHHPERHTAEHIAEYLDQMVQNMPPLLDCNIVATVDQADK